MRLRKYIYAEILPPLLLGIVLYTAVILFGYFFVGSQYLDGVGLVKILKWLGIQIPDSFVKVAPMAVVLMTVLAFGRMNTEREIIAMQSGGISFSWISKPVVLVATLVSLTSLVVSEYVTPRANLEARTMWYEDLPSTPQGLSRLKGTTLTLGNGLEVYFQNYDPNTDTMKDIRLVSWADKQARVYFAETGQFDGFNLALTGFEGYAVDFPAIKQIQSAGLDDLSETVQNVFSSNIPDQKDAVLTIKTGISRNEAIARFADGFAAETTSISELWNTAYGAHVPGEKGRVITAADQYSARMELHGKLAIPFANLVLALISMPLAIRYGRGTGVSLGVSVLIVVVYYLTLLLGRAFASAGILPPEVGLWFANVFFTLIGWRLIRRVS
ncbi:LptF/LptG family permease [Deinococcus misasensis]|uniref:LptF/LptG family permease n=1 Tax=Deinococcus misasensis TaxID=392413 RepID=UPI00054EE550|nr:LptF/LptG family permease [Deinococcus misasensis]